MSQEYALPCSCGSKTSVQVRHAGESIACSGCGELLTVPRLRELKQLEAVESGSPTKAVKSWTAIQGGLFAAGLLFAVLAAGSAFYTNGIRQRMNYKRPDMKDIRFHMDMNEIDLANSWEVWQTYKKNFERRSIEQRRTPLHVLARERVSVLNYWLIVQACLGTLGLVLMGLSFFIR